MKWLKENKDIVGVIAGIIGVVFGLMLIAPILMFGFGYLGGMILSKFVGDSVVNGLNLMFNTSRFTVNDIPLLSATLAMIGSYFKSTQTNNNK